MLASIDGLNHQGQHVKNLSSFYDNQGKVPIIKLSIWRDTFKTSNELVKATKIIDAGPSKTPLSCSIRTFRALFRGNILAASATPGKVTQARFNTTWNTEGQFCHGSCCSNVDEILTAIGTTNIHLNGLIFFNNAGSCHGSPSGSSRHAHSHWWYRSG